MIAPARFFDRFFKPPYPWLPQLVFVFVVTSFLFHSLSPLHTGRLQDPDDYTRLVQVMNWLTHEGGPLAGWYDTVQPRLNPGENFVVPWSRLVDLPLAGFTALFAASGLPLKLAALYAALIVPVILFLLLLKLLPVMAAPVTGKDYAKLVTLFVPFTHTLLFQFTPGRVDHHAWQLLIAGFGLAALIRLVQRPYAIKWAVAAGITFACGFWIGAEILPWLMLFTLCLGIARLSDPFAMERSGTIFGASLFLANLALLPMARPPEMLMELSISWYSAAYVLAAFAVFLWLAGIEFVACRTLDIRKRFLRAAAIGIVIACGVALALPQAWHGIYADYKPAVAAHIMQNVIEAQPFTYQLSHTTYDPQGVMALLARFCTFILFPLVGAAISWRRHILARDATRIIWLFFALFTSAAVLLQIFWQMRVTSFACLFALVPATALLLQLREALAHGEAAVQRRVYFTGKLLLLGVVIAFGATTARGERPWLDVLLFPMTHKKLDCNLPPVARYLEETYGKPMLIMNDINDGAELLYRTKHSVFAAPYNTAGNLVPDNFFSSIDDKAAHNILLNNKADLVLICRYYSIAYDTQEGVPETEPTLAARLAAGDPPAWLKPVPLPEGSDYKLYRPAGK